MYVYLTIYHASNTDKIAMNTDSGTHLAVKITVEMSL